MEMATRKELRKRVEAGEDPEPEPEPEEEEVVILEQLRLTSSQAEVEAFLGVLALPMVRVVSVARVPDSEQSTMTRSAGERPKIVAKRKM